MEKRVEVKTYKVVFECHECKKGELNYIDTMFSTDLLNRPKSQLIHRCSNCKETFELNYKYPSIEYIEVEKEINNEG